MTKHQAKQKQKVDRVLKRAAAYERRHVKPGYYLETAEGRDAGTTYCRRCAEKMKRDWKQEDKIDWTIYAEDTSGNHDSLHTCDHCGVDLEGFFTDYGAKEQLEIFEAEGIDLRRGLDCYAWSLCEVSFVSGSEEYKALLKLIVVTS